MTNVLWLAVSVRTACAYRETRYGGLCWLLSSRRATAERSHSRFGSDWRYSREFLAYLPRRHLYVVIGLKIQPELRRRAEDLRQAQRGIRRYTRFFI